MQSGVSKYSLQFTLVPPEGEQPKIDLTGTLCDVFKLAASECDPTPVQALLKQCFCVFPAEMWLTSVPVMMAAWLWLTY